MFNSNLLPDASVTVLSAPGKTKYCVLGRHRRGCQDLGVNLHYYFWYPGLIYLLCLALPWH